MQRAKSLAIVLVLFPLQCPGLWAQGVEATVHGGVYVRRQVVCVPVISGQVGDTAFDPADENRIYVLLDDEPLLGGGVYRLDDSQGMLVRSEILVGADRPSGITFTPDGDLWFVRDFGAAGGYLLRVAAPRLCPPCQSEVMISNFQTEADDDPKVVGTAPPGFAGALVQPGDVIIGDAGADSDAPNALLVYSPGAPQGNPAAFDTFLVAPGGFSDFDDINMTDFDFAPDGAALFVLFDNGSIVRVTPDGGVSGPLEFPGFDTSSARALAVNPRDGRIWIGIQKTAQLWSLDPAKGDAKLEISFTKLGDGWPLDPIRFHSPSLRFRPDGARLVVTDALSQLWIFDSVDAEPNHPPIAQIRNDTPGQVIAMVNGSATFELDGTASSDGDGGTQGLTFLWSQVVGPADADIESTNSPKTHVEFSAPGIYIFALEVDDGQAKEHRSTSQLGLGVLSFDAIQDPTQDATFESFQVFPMGGIAGDVAFAPGAPEMSGFFALVDDVVSEGGGLYEVVREGGAYRRGEKMAELDRPSSLTFTPDGALWVVRDFSSSDGPYVTVLRQPGAKPRAPLAPVIMGFAGPGDDDPFALAIVPAGFGGDKAAAGDLLILDHGVDADGPNGIYVFSPGKSGQVFPAFADFFSTPEQLKGYAGVNLYDLVFSVDGTRLIVGSHDGRLVELDNAGNVIGSVVPGDPVFSDAAGLAIDPQTGRLWVADANFLQVWSMDLESGDARAEISFVIGIAGLGFLPIELHAPSLTFSPDGQRLVVSDAGNRGWLWVFERPPQQSRALFRRGDADGNASVDISDAIRILAFLFIGGQAPPCLDAADGDDSGDPDISDAVFVLLFLFTGGAAPPPPGPTNCGEDPTTDDPLTCGAGSGC